MITDHKAQAVFKGGDILKMGNLFNFTTDKIGKPFFDLVTLPCPHFVAYRGLGAKKLFIGDRFNYT
ncbi:hypothetical protein EON73_01825 [bacterium]|nr:MAG: hypothetical protein EON73_01825 [bacterium]